MTNSIMYLVWDVTGQVWEEGTVQADYFDLFLKIKTPLLVAKQQVVGTVAEWTAYVKRVGI